MHMMNVLCCLWLAMTCFIHPPSVAYMYTISQNTPVMEEWHVDVFSCNWLVIGHTCDFVISPMVVSWTDSLTWFSSPKICVLSWFSQNVLFSAGQYFTSIFCSILSFKKNMCLFELQVFPFISIMVQPPLSLIRYFALHAVRNILSKVFTAVHHLLQ